MFYEHITSKGKNKGKHWSITERETEEIKDDAKMAEIFNNFFALVFTEKLTCN